jgi:hypothetical protein
MQSRNLPQIILSSQPSHLVTTFPFPFARTLQVWNIGELGITLCSQACSSEALRTIHT